MAVRPRNLRSSQRPRQNGYSEFYSATSEAHDIFHDRHRKTRKVKRVRKKRVTRKEPKFRLNMNNRPKVAFMPYVALSVFFLGLISVVFISVMSIERRMEINALTREYQELQSANLLKTAQLARSHDLREIELLAATRLGMVSPAGHQMIRISVPRQNYVVQNLAAQEEDDSIFSRISAFSRRVFAMVSLW